MITAAELLSVFQFNPQQSQVDQSWSQNSADRFAQILAAEEERQASQPHRPLLADPGLESSTSAGQDGEPAAAVSEEEAAEPQAAPQAGSGVPAGCTGWDMTDDEIGQWAEEFYGSWDPWRLERHLAFQLTLDHHLCGLRHSARFRELVAKELDDTREYIQKIEAGEIDYDPQGGMAQFEDWDYEVRPNYDPSLGTV